MFPLRWCSSRSPRPLDIGDRKQLFTDERFIAEREQTELRGNPPQKRASLRDENDKPFQGHVACVIDDGTEARLQCVCWKGKAAVSVLAGKPVRLHVNMKRNCTSSTFTKD